MENFIVSARKYRPDTFDSVVGQESITKTLKNAIRNKHLAQAYLFCGPRGVGKTTCARIFAKTINCQNLDANIEPCNKCESCLSFNESRSFNIHELDAASNNSVDDIRSLIDQVRIPPQVGKNSVYIIDEVHMLSQAAFNAFLKTLEEPPSHATFILATTEKHKIIPTILSRCQIFDFNRIQISDISKHLQKIANNEKINCESDALTIIAQKADGGLRDALSIFDQLVSFSGSSITYKDVIENLNILDYDYFFKITEDFINNNISGALLSFNEILNDGFDSRNFLLGLCSHFRDLMVCKDASTIQLLEVGESIKERYLKQTGITSIQFLIQGLDILNKCDLAYGGSKNKRLHVEIALLQLCDITTEKKNSEPLVNNNFAEPVKPASNPTAVSEKQSSQQQQQPKTETSSKPNFSIKSALINNSAKEQVQNSAAKEETLQSTIISLSNETLKEIWSTFALSIKDERPRLYNTLINQTPALISDNKIELSASNPLQLEAIEDIKNQIVKYIYQKTNTTVDIQITLNEDVVQERKYFTSEDRFNHLKNKNPKLEELRKEFNLDFD